MSPDRENNVKKNLLSKFYFSIPTEYEDEFTINIYKENISRSIAVSLFLPILETAVLVIIYENIITTSSIILFNIMALPVLYIAGKRINTKNLHTWLFIYYVYLFVQLSLGCALSVVSQGQLASINVYIIFVFGIASFFSLRPAASFIIFFAVYLLFFFTLPYFQENIYAVNVFRTNSLLMNLFAWVLSQMVFNMKKSVFIDKKIIEEKNLQLRDIAIRDSMTSLLNHTHSIKKLQEEIKRAARILYPLSVMMIDIDFFKSVNDRYGHQTGDKVLVKLAQVLRQTCRDTDIIGRYGGEEFIIIMPGTTLQDAAVLGERIRKTIAETKFTDGISITVSGGIAQYTGQSAEEMIKDADLHLYKAKFMGRNRFEMNQQA